MTEELRVLAIGIGAGPERDGQVLVLHNMLGLYDELAPRFAKVYAPWAPWRGGAVAAFVREVRKAGKRGRKPFS